MLLESELDSSEGGLVRSKMSLSLFRIDDEIINGCDNFAEEDLLVLIAGSAIPSQAYQNTSDRLCYKCRINWNTRH